jgi:hypothetical protein
MVAFYISIGIQANLKLFHNAKNLFAITQRKYKATSPPGFRGFSDDSVDPLQQGKIYRKDRKSSSGADEVSERAGSWLLSILEADAVQNPYIEPPKQCKQLIGLWNVEEAVKDLQC